MLRTEQLEFAIARIPCAAILFWLSHSSDSFSDGKLHLHVVIGKSVAYFPISSEIEHLGTGFAFATAEAMNVSRSL